MESRITSIEIINTSSGLYNQDEIIAETLKIFRTGQIKHLQYNGWTDKPVNEYDYKVNVAEIADNYGHEIYRCAKCGEFYERFHLRLEFAAGSYEVPYKCHRCKIELNPIEYDIKQDDGWEEKSINLDKYPFSKCSKHSLYERVD